MFFLIFAACFFGSSLSGMGKVIQANPFTNPGSKVILYGTKKPSDDQIEEQSFRPAHHVEPVVLRPAEPVQLQFNKPYPFLVSPEALWWRDHGSQLLSHHKKKINDYITFKKDMAILYLKYWTMIRSRIITPMDTLAMTGTFYNYKQKLADAHRAYQCDAEVELLTTGVNRLVPALDGLDGALPTLSSLIAPELKQFIRHEEINPAFYYMAAAHYLYTQLNN